MGLVSSKKKSEVLDNNYDVKESFHSESNSDSHPRKDDASAFSLFQKMNEESSVVMFDDGEEEDKQQSCAKSVPLGRHICKEVSKLPLPDDNEDHSFDDFIEECTQYYDIANMSDSSKIKTNEIEDKVPNVPEEKVRECEVRVSKIPRSDENCDLLDKPPLACLIALYTTSYGVYKALNKYLRERTLLRPTPYDQYTKNLILALRNLPRCSATVYRAQTHLESEDVFSEGRLVGYKNFLSSSKSRKATERFAENKGTFFQIKTITGRDISPYSLYPYEKEVLILPGTIFKVTKAEMEKEFFYVEMEERQFGFGQKVLLWVDDSPKDNSHLINLMEQYGTKPICVRSTKEALEWLDLDTNASLLNKDLASFRIVTDMKRKKANGEWDETAGLDLVKSLREMKYNHRILMYVRRVKQCRKVLDEASVAGVTVTNDLNLTLDFGAFLCEFEDLEDKNMYEVKPKWF